MDITEKISLLKKEGFQISTDKEKLQLDVIHNFLKSSYWAKGVPFEIVERAVKNSFGVGVYYKNIQIGFARLVTDYAVMAHLADVFILEEYRGKGLSKWLMHEIMNHPKFKGLRKWTLATNDAHGLYKQFGFKIVESPEKNMEIDNPDVYKK